MNKTALDTTINLLENLPANIEQGFNMRTFSGEAYYYAHNVEHECKTVACIAGWVSEFVSMDGTHLLSRKRSKRQIYADGSGNYMMLAAKILGLKYHETDYVQADQLFCPMDMGRHDFDVEFDPGEVDWGDITPAEAARVLRHLRDTGEIDWNQR